MDSPPGARAEGQVQAAASCDLTFRATFRTHHLLCRPTPPALQSAPACLEGRPKGVSTSAQGGQSQSKRPKVQLCTSKFPSEIIAKRVPGTLG